MTFSADISAWVAQSQLSGVTVMKKVLLDGMKGVQLRSPVNEGRFRGSHRLTVNSVDTSVEPPAADGAGADVSYGQAPTSAEQASAIAALEGMQWGDTGHVTNNLPYARPLEDGLSAQNDNQVDGIYGATAAELAANIGLLVRASRVA